MPAITCILVSHNKPKYVPEAIQSVVNQDFTDWQLIIVDSGVLLSQGFYDTIPHMKDERILLIPSNETEEIRQTRAIAPWCFNECYRRNLVQGDVVCYLGDDDIYYPNAFGVYVAFISANPNIWAMYASQDFGAIHDDGRRVMWGERRAHQKGGVCCQGQRMDCVVDMLQFCHRKEVTKFFPPGQFWPEDLNAQCHLDGILMERIGCFVPIYPIDIKTSCNRKTSQSCYQRP